MFLQAILFAVRFLLLSDQDNIDMLQRAARKVDL
jgi:hypothetical protein